jgi:3-oxoacyl-[acyl-carrier protein] reductase
MGRTLGGQVIVVAGGTGNVGRVLVRALLGAGATVVVPSRSHGGAERVVAQAAGSEPVLLHGNIGEQDDALRLRDEILSRYARIDAVVATLGHFVPASTLLSATERDLRTVLESYPIAHFVVARTFIPALERVGGAYAFINGPLAFDALYPGTGLVSVATAAQAMLARVVMKEAATAGSRVRINEVVLYTSFGRPGDDVAPQPVAHSDVGQFIAELLAPAYAQVRGRTIHLNSRAALKTLSAAPEENP